MHNTKTTRRELTTFLVVAFAVPYLMGVPLAFAQRARVCLPTRRCYTPRPA